MYRAIQVVVSIFSIEEAQEWCDDELLFRQQLKWIPNVNCFMVIATYAIQALCTKCGLKVNKTQSQLMEETIKHLNDVQSIFADDTLKVDCIE